MADYFLQIDGVAGESRDAKHAGWIDVLSWSWGEANAASVGAGSGATAGRVAFQDFSFMTPVSKASTTLFLACAMGQRFKTAKLAGQKVGKGVDDYLTWTFSDILVTAYQASASSGDDAPMESISLNVSRAVLSYKALKPDGTFDTAVTSGFDIKTNTKV